MRQAISDWSDGISYNAGAPTATQKVWLDINWTFPSNAPTPVGFDVVAYTGTDPTNTANYLFAPVRVEATDRRLVISVTPNASASTINAAVRAVYA